MDQITFRNKKGKPCYIADSKGNIRPIKKDGKPGPAIQVTEKGSEEVVITKEDLEASK